MQTPDAFCINVMNVTTTKMVDVEEWQAMNAFKVCLDSTIELIE